MFNPTRRSRKIGKTQGGRVSDGKAREKWSRLFFTTDVWKRLSDPKTPGLRVLRENPSRDYFHPVTEEEIREVLARLPAALTEGLKAVVLSRLSKDDEKRGVEARIRFQCVILLAFPKSMQMIWKGFTAPDRALSHYQPWCSNWSENEGNTVLTWSRDELRRYYLFHLLLHEIGHHNQPTFHSLKRREAFAENFALEWARRWEIIP